MNIYKKQYRVRYCQINDGHFKQDLGEVVIDWMNEEDVDITYSNLPEPKPWHQYQLDERYVMIGYYYLDLAKNYKDSEAEK